MIGKIDQLQNNLAKRFDNLVSLAAIPRGDRADTAVTQYSMKTETAGLVCDPKSSAFGVIQC